jgi:hypothetical protein
MNDPPIAVSGSKLPRAEAQAEPDSAELAIDLVAMVNSKAKSTVNTIGN